MREVPRAYTRKTVKDTSQVFADVGHSHAVQSSVRVAESTIRKEPLQAFAHRKFSIREAMRTNVRKR